jgi:uncharacterized protein YjeT (DUF2065 family)
MSTATLNIIGLVLNLVGVIILFRYGMPFHVPTGGAVHLIAEQVDAAEKALESRYEVFGYFGLVAIVVGTGMQIVGAYRAG